MNYKLLTIIALSILTSCNQKNELLQDKPEKSCIDSTMTRYTFSQIRDIDFTVSVGSYQILYDYSSPIDTFFVYSGSFIIGQDSILYLQVRKDKSAETKEVTEKIYQGSITKLILFDGKKFNTILPPYFNPNYSAFTVKNKDLYYWGFEKLYACKYNLITREFQKIKLSNETGGTDFFGSYDIPYINEKGNIEFSVSEGQRLWLIDLNLEKIISFKEDPSELYFYSGVKGDTL